MHGVTHMNYLEEQKHKYIELAEAIEFHNADYKIDDAEKMSVQEICTDYGKYTTLKERQVLESILKYHPEVTIISEDKADELKILRRTDFVYEIEKNSYFVETEFLNNFNSHVLNHKYDSIPPLDDDEEEAIHEMREITQARRYYEDFQLADLLERYNTEELKQICREFKITGFSKGSKSDIVDLIQDKFTNKTSLMFKRLTQKELNLIAYFIAEESNVIPYTHLDALSAKTFFIQVQDDYEILYMPMDIFEDLEDYFEKNDLNPLDFLDEADRELLEEIEKYQKLNSLPINEDEDIDTAISAFVEAGKDEDMREMFKEMFDLNQDSDDAKVMNAIIDGKVTSQEELDQFLEELHSKPQTKTQEQNHKSSGNVIDFNQYRR